MNIDDTDSLADRVQNHGRLLVDQVSFESEKVALVADDQVVMTFANRSQRVVVRFDDVEFGFVSES